jgi:hypothetical protein
MKNLKYVFVVLIAGFLIGCSDDERAESLEIENLEVRTLFNDTPLDMSAYVIQDSAAQAESFPGSSLGVPDPNQGGVFRCCEIFDLIYYGPPNQPQVAYVIEGASYFDNASNWFLRATFVNNVTGQVLFDNYYNDPTVTRKLACDDKLNGAFFLGFGPQVGVGIRCPNDFTFTLRRYYEIDFSGTLYECSSESIDISLPENPDLPPCV